MTLRAIEIFLPKEKQKEMEELLKDRNFLGIWNESLPGDIVHTKLLMLVEETGIILDFLEKNFSGEKGFRAVIMPVEATIPEINEAEEKESSLKQELPALGVSRQELYANIEGSSKLSGIYIVLVILSAIVAGIGILRNNVAIIIGAMVIALLAPNVALHSLLE